MSPYSTGNFQLSPFVTHLAAIGFGAASFYLSSPTFVAHFPLWAQDAVSPTLALLTWVGVTQVQAAQPPVVPK